MFYVKSVIMVPGENVATGKSPILLKRPFMKILFIIGTRPEAIKTAPVIKMFDQDRERFDYRVCVTAQHREMLDDVLRFFDVRPDYDLNVMKPKQTLYDITAHVLLGLKPVLEDYRPDNIFIQGDTATVMAAALAAFYQKVSISHLEAGLRSGDLYSPYPEEANRRMTGHIADYHFAPTHTAVNHLTSENITRHVWHTGNTVIDALLLGQDINLARGDAPFTEYFTNLDLDRRVILITGHRRESFGRPFETVCRALLDIAAEHPDVQLVYPVHLNPNVHDTVHRLLGGRENIFLWEPLSYPYLIWLMSKAYLVITDSGGIQEEAPALGKPVLVTREVTERTEGIDAGTAVLVGTDYDKITTHVRRLLTDESAYAMMANAVNPYGDGRAAERIVDIYCRDIFYHHTQSREQTT